MSTTANLRFLITAGPTREWIDPIRFISNRSSGKMGYALAEAARKLSRHVTLVTGPTALAKPAGVAVVNVTTAAEMAKAVLARFERCDAVIMAAAVCDFRPARIAKLKIKKDKFPGTLTLKPTIDILARLGKRKRHQVLVGFAAETDHLEKNARGKLRRKNLNLIVANGPAAFDSDRNQVTLIQRDGRSERLALMSKRSAAKEIMGRVVRLLP